MQKTIIILICILVTLINLGCSDIKQNDKNSEKDKNLTFGDFVEMDKVDKVKMSNNSGSFYLTNEQIEKLKKELSTMVYDPDIAVKVGSIQIELYINGKPYLIGCKTHGDYIEVHCDLVTKNKNKINNQEWLYFKTNGVNFDNYLKENQ